ncbi:MAG: phosphoribosylaminoimidazolecarboxamide formyltransferase [Clostridium sp.]|uniref:phosphoribosylaminoimidazolecarboxamide formyltransferase n=1 Tax=Clostridium sp. TaxID=1506 RepID=UPI0025B7A87C|nr:phosphoribosylaminoimidazolecarboxamide formyltransferase [Clostridium sp.]MCH3963274.1 phosphoribosylaminoimidazolecarboxamide formyltransferase [Clostridium sp.]MCI1717341.1 phosphoribosylaminoimidazolecarboxamide formyltransferase [Clostridium sp.]MCI1801681.1 phosphoribosylaminoimidazolecarboxamide formyltransferase [Clostridium sp.]MCI1815527.1 phosphoribosylaminoimidazolecarboxamide formyltransferase [Clostridium sp.]MCI1872430.1 phosphoribosylaminoimidazolecarboxamide formyltransfera
MKNNELILKYGCNPHQKPARVYMKKGELPFRIINGKPGYINLMDALNSWQLVKELKNTTGIASAASFKHVSPAGAAVAVQLDDILKKVYAAGDEELSPAATAYCRARGADRMSSYGDFAALSDEVDLSTAKVLKSAVSDGIIAPAYSKEALEVLKKKKRGNYCIIQIDRDYEPCEMEKREIFGVTFEQKRNNAIITDELLKNIVTKRKDLTQNAKRDLLISMITLKYTQSNSVCFVLDGQVIGVGAGQQSRIHCTRLAGSKADVWFLRQHPSVLSLPFRDGLKKAEKDNAIDQYLRNDVTEEETRHWKDVFTEVPRKLTEEEKKNWISKLKGVSLGSDAFFPFRDNIDRASKSGVEYIVEPGGSIRDDAVIEACNDYNMVMAFSDLRLFHH